MTLKTEHRICVFAVALIAGVLFKISTFSKSYSENSDKTELGRVKAAVGEDVEKTIAANRIVFAMYYIDSCRHCNSAFPEFLKAGNSIKDCAVTFVTIDCSLDMNKKVCQTEKINAYPTFLLYKEGKLVTEYRMRRSHTDFVNFIETEAI